MTKPNREVHQCDCGACHTSTEGSRPTQHHQMNILLSKLNEAQRRWYVGSLSQQEDGPSDRELMRITGLDAKTIRRGRRELRNGEAEQLGSRQRLAGGGRHAAEKKTAG